MRPLPRCLATLDSEQAVRLPGSSSKLLLRCTMPTVLCRSTSNQETFKAECQGRLVFDVLRQVRFQLSQHNAFRMGKFTGACQSNASTIVQRFKGWELLDAVVTPHDSLGPDKQEAPGSSWSTAAISFGQPSAHCQIWVCQVLTGQGLATFTLTDCNQSILGETIELLAPHHLAALQQQVALGDGGGGAGGEEAVQQRVQSQRAAALRLAR